MKKIRRWRIDILPVEDFWPSKFRKRLFNSCFDSIWSRTLPIRLLLRFCTAVETKSKNALVFAGSTENLVANLNEFLNDLTIDADSRCLLRSWKRKINFTLSIKSQLNEIIFDFSGDSRVEGALLSFNHCYHQIVINATQCSRNWMMLDLMGIAIEKRWKA